MQVAATAETAGQGTAYVDMVTVEAGHSQSHEQGVSGARQVRDDSLADLEAGFDLTWIAALETQMASLTGSPWHDHIRDTTAAEADRVTANRNHERDLEKAINAANQDYRDTVADARVDLSIDRAQAEADDAAQEVADDIAEATGDFDASSGAPSQPERLEYVAGYGEAYPFNDRPGGTGSASI